jgi:pimeloyl-ACP methyl ester carboxylesterase
MRLFAAGLYLAASAWGVAQEIVLTEGLGVTIPGQRRSMLRQDPVEDLLVSGLWTMPIAGAQVGGRAWQKVQANEKGEFSGPFTGSGYIWFSLASASEKTMLLEAQGCSMVYVNGEPRVGDVYGFGYVSLPVRLKKGENHFLFAMGRGFLRAKLVEAPAPLTLDVRDATTPDLLEGGKGKEWSAVVVRNAEPGWAKGLSIEAKPLDGGRTIRTAVPDVLPMSCRKAGFQIDGGATGTKFRLRLLRGSQVLHESELTLRRRVFAQAHKRTFVSAIDGSVQYYAALPSSRPGAGQALFLSLHGASVEAIGQAEAYGAKSWGHVIAPTNRRPFGFNWEDIGRKDGLEVLEIARKAFATDPSQTYVTGHSMGGHGSWHFGVHFPDKFAGTAPAAGWISYWSYAGGAEFNMEDPVQARLRRASNGSDTLKLISNLAPLGVFVLHGDADETVPVKEARTMREALATFHKDLHWHEEKGQGHWYDTDPEPGANCMDYRPIFDLFSRRRVASPESVYEVDFVTASPSISPRAWWAEVAAQEAKFEYSRIKLQRSPSRRLFWGTTENVLVLRLQALGMTPGAPVKLEIDGQSLEVTYAPQLTLKKEGGKWRDGSGLSSAELAQLTTWSWKDVLDHRVVVVAGTQGPDDVDAMILQQARFLSESMWYVGNGALDVVIDADWKPEKFVGRNVLLIGGPEENSAWSVQLGSQEIQPLKGRVQEGRTRTDGSFAVLVSAPKPNEPGRLVGAIAATDLAGWRKAQRIPILTAGAGVAESLLVPVRK